MHTDEDMLEERWERKERRALQCALQVPSLESNPLPPALPHPGSRFAATIIGRRHSLSNLQDETLFHSVLTYKEMEGKKLPENHQE